MQLNRCPVCHARISLDAIVQDESGRELLGILAKLDTETAMALIAYLGLFRSKSQDLSNKRALKLAKECLALVEPSHFAALAEAMNITADQIRAKGGDSLSNHRYLAKVLGDCIGFKPDISYSKEVSKTGGNRSKTAQSLDKLEDFINGN